MRPSQHSGEPAWWGWGDPARAPALSEEVRGLLAQALGVRAVPRRPPSLSEVDVRPIRIAPTAVAEFAEVVGDENVLTDSEARIRHTRGKSTLDLLRARVGDAASAPDIVLLPGSHDEVLDLLRRCSERRIAVLPFGGGTSVVGGLEPDASGFAGVAALDLRRMSALLGLDEESRTAELEPGLRGPEAEALLGARGYTIGHYPQSFEHATLGGFAAARSSGQASAGYGRFDDLVVALKAATPAGTLELGRAPKSAAGPDLRQLFLGSEGTLGVITALTVQVSPRPARSVYEGWQLPSFRSGIAALRVLAQDGPLPTVLRLSDEPETAIGLARPGQLGVSFGGGGCLAVVGYQGSASDVDARRAGATRVLERFGATPEPDAGEQWERQRFEAPYLRDALLDAGALVETLETATFWSSLETLYQAVSAALQRSLSDQGTPPVVLCHVSHVYPTGASLYFTVACAQLEDPVAQWRAAKAAASDAILAAGGSISHHHGVGVDHRDWYEREVGDLALRALRAVKAQLDPAGILNPGILLSNR